MPYNIDELANLQTQVQDAIYQKGNRYGQIGLASANGFYIPSDERNKRTISVTLENGTIVLADSQRVTPIPGAKVRLRMESGLWVIKGADEREILSKPSNKSVNVAPHNHNVGSAPGMFYPIDPASVNNGMLYPTGSGLQCTVGRTEYSKLDGSLGIYDSLGTLNFASAATGLSANQSRWAIAYILKTDGSVNFHSATVGTAPLNTTSDLEAAIAECLSTVSNSAPFHAVRIRAGVSTFDTYKPMVGASVDNKDFIRIGIGSGGGGGAYGYPNPITASLYLQAGYAMEVLAPLEVASGATLEIASGATLTIFEPNTGKSYAPRAVSANYTITTDDQNVFVDASGGAVTITLPDSATITGRVFNIKAIDVSGGSVTIATTSSQTIDGATTLSLTIQYENITVQAVNSNWYIL